MNDYWKTFIDYVVAPLAIALNLVFQFLPSVAFIVPIVYYSIQIYESRTFKVYRQNLQNRRMAQLSAKILRLKAKMVEKQVQDVISAEVSRVVSAGKVAQTAAVADLANNTVHKVEIGPKSTL